MIIRSTQSNVVHCKSPVPRPGSRKVADQPPSDERTNGKVESTIESTMNSTIESTESANVSLNTSTNLSAKESTTTASTTSEHKSEYQLIERQGSPLADEILNALESKENGGSINEVVNKLKSTKLQVNKIHCLSSSPRRRACVRSNNSTILIVQCYSLFDHLSLYVYLNMCS